MVVDSKKWAPERPRSPEEFGYLVRCPREMRFAGSLTKWLLEEIGIADRDWAYNWMNSKLYFKTEEDRVKFILRWL